MSTADVSHHRPTFAKKICDKLGFAKVSETPPPHPRGGSVRTQKCSKKIACGALFLVFFRCLSNRLSPKISALRAGCIINVSTQVSNVYYPLGKEKKNRNTQRQCKQRKNIKPQILHQCIKYQIPPPKNPTFWKAFTSRMGLNNMKLISK